MGRWVATVVFLVGMLHASDLLAASTRQATAPSITFYSTVNETAFACLAAEALEPATARHGPFVIPAPGLKARHTTFTIAGLECTRDDWTQALAALAAWVDARAEATLRLVAPDGRVFLFARPPLARSDRAALAGTARCLRPDGDVSHVFLRITHDGAKSLLIDARPIDDRLASAASASGAPLSSASQ